jgi:hypothetical protein
MQLFSSHVVPRHLSLARLQRVKNWHRSQQNYRPVEYQAWDAVLMLWLMGWVGVLPTLVFSTADLVPLFPPLSLCLLGMLSPQLYARLRAYAHERQWLRCDWLDQLQ